jgi:hypothetical protein
LPIKIVATAQNHKIDPGLWISGPHRGHGDEHVVDALAVAEVRVVSVLEVSPRVAGVLQQVAKSGGGQNLLGKKVFTLSKFVDTFFLK